MVASSDKLILGLLFFRPHPSLTVAALPCHPLSRKHQQYDCKWYIPLADLTFQTLDDSDSCPHVQTMPEHEIEEMKTKISAIKSEIQKEKVSRDAVLGAASPRPRAHFRPSPSSCRPVGQRCGSGRYVTLHPCPCRRGHFRAAAVPVKSLEEVVAPAVPLPKSAVPGRGPGPPPLLTTSWGHALSGSRTACWDTWASLSQTAIKRVFFPLLVCNMSPCDKASVISSGTPVFVLLLLLKSLIWKFLLLLATSSSIACSVGRSVNKYSSKVDACANVVVAIANLLLHFFSSGSSIQWWLLQKRRKVPR